MKRSLLIVLAVLLLLAVSACDSSKETESPKTTVTVAPPTEPTEPDEPNMISGTVYAVSGADAIQEIDFGYEEGALTPEHIAEALTARTGLDFDISSTTADGAITVDWKSTSTLIGGLGDKDQKEEFYFFDVDSLNWFMMNSLCMSIQKNFDNIDVYYTMEGGQPLELDKLSPPLSISPGIAYNLLDNENVCIG